MAFPKKKENLYRTLVGIFQDLGIGEFIIL